MSTDVFEFEAMTEEELESASGGCCGGGVNVIQVGYGGAPCVYPPPAYGAYPPPYGAYGGYGGYGGSGGYAGAPVIAGYAAAPRYGGGVGAGVPYGGYGYGASSFGLRPGTAL